MTEVKRLAIFYGWPSTVNATYTVAGAIAVFKQYDIIVFGSGLESPTHGDHANTVAIIAGLPKRVAVYGYVDSPLGIATTGPSIDAWAAMGVAGIFCDEFGYDFSMTRALQNTLVDYIHGKNLSAFVNAWNPDDAFAPSGDTLTHLGANDWFLAESYQIINDSYQTTDDWRSRSDKLKNYKKATGTSIATVTTTQLDSTLFDQGKFDFAYFSTAIYGFDAFGWGEKNFSASDGKLPFHARKKYYGDQFVSDIQTDGGLVKRYTNVGIQVNTITKTVDYVINV